VDTPILTAAPAEDSEIEDFAQLLREDSLARATAIDTSGGSKLIDATVIALTPDSVLLDIGYKTEGILPLTAFATDAKPVEPGDKVRVTVNGRAEDGYYLLTRQRGVAAPVDYGSLEEAFEAKGIVSGTVTGVVKGGLTVDIGLRAFLPSSRSGTRDAAELDQLVGQTIRVRITSLDLDGSASEKGGGRPDAVVDRRSVLEEEAKVASDARFSELAEGQVVPATVRSLTSFGAFLDLNGADALLHISDIAWHRVEDPATILTVGDQLEVQILKIDNADATKRRIAVGLKQLQPHPWDAVPATYSLGQKVTGKVTRETDFGAFIELAPGIEGLIHISEMAWGKKVRKPSDIVKVGDHVEAVILAIDPEARRIGLGLKQALGDPFAEALKTLHPGATVEGKISQITKFGAFLTVTEGVEGLIHISEITTERRLNHPSDVLRVGETVKALVLEIDKDKRQLRLSMKQLVPTGLDEFLAEHAVGDTVTGRIIEIDHLSNTARVELGEGIIATASVPALDPTDPGTTPPTSGAPVDLSQLGSLLSSKWKTAHADTKAAPKPSRPAAGIPTPGQVRTFKITTLDAATKQIALGLA
jgi:small subunit ribosomal protein S1